MSKEWAKIPFPEMKPREENLDRLVGRNGLELIALEYLLILRKPWYRKFLILQTVLEIKMPDFPK